MRSITTLLLSLLVLLPICLALVADDEIYLTFQVPSSHVECFFVPVVKPEYKVMEFSYTVAKGKDILVKMRDPRMVDLVEDEKRRYHFHRIVIGSAEGSLGDYTICLDNSYSYESKTVSISLHLLDSKGEYVRSQASLNPIDNLKIAVDVFEASTQNLMTNIDKADRLLVQVRGINQIDRSLAEQNFERVNFYGTLNTVVMIASAITQVFLVRSLLTEDSKVGRLLRRGTK
ncbi:hypothetical protein Q1695_005478 [Nippostrongylus brasiliensis]|nr:hypothetical protein Q1695_005478 [Nippostrongylus brasiliensis]